MNSNDGLPESLRVLFKKVRLLVFDFDGVFTDNCVYVSEDGKESVSCWRSDGLGLSKIKKLGLPVHVVSTEVNSVVSARCKKLEISCTQGCQDKLSAVKELIVQHKCHLADVMYVGNDINDLDCLKEVGLPVVVSDAHPDVLEYAAFKTECPGGRGAVRELCDIIVREHSA